VVEFLWVSRCLLRIQEKSSVIHSSHTFLLSLDASHINLPWETLATVREKSTLFLRIPEVPLSIPELEPLNLDNDSSKFSLVLPVSAEMVPYSRPRPLPHPFQFITVILWRNTIYPINPYKQLKKVGGTRYAASRKVAGSSTDEVDFLNWPNLWAWGRLSL
jgi:hypothetical protein